MIGMIVVVCAAFGLTLSEAKTEIMCLRAKGMPVYNQTNGFVYLGENVNHNADLSIKVDRRIRNAWCSFRKYTLELYDRPSAASRSKPGCSEPRYLRQRCTAASRGARARTTTTRCAEPTIGS